MQTHTTNTGTPGVAERTQVSNLQTSGHLRRGPQKYHGETNRCCECNTQLKLTSKLAPVKSAKTVMAMWFRRHFVGHSHVLFVTCYMLLLLLLRSNSAGPPFRHCFCQLHMLRADRSPPPIFGTWVARSVENHTLMNTQPVIGLHATITIPCTIVAVHVVWCMCRTPATVARPTPIACNPTPNAPMHPCRLLTPAYPT
jgi:hypothetical protein